ncbi:hypothetical protein CMQ_7404 [Grosmannia clavigera kw1407]|uniref:DUF5672 domain-containing protein n=1 Tax=Grosmannia clavigera (strain kw1407 / UAMH 11150) TaxID=655863 RepID=F0XPR9_GROCL|nr:uncharacterized protein CMQ_7404 [Grosmannia clavigera kw1407]EFX00402.1 hypothetical protein CMQ_7404 [Grosmannia clavigera kw1407]
MLFADESGWKERIAGSLKNSNFNDMKNTAFMLVMALWAKTTRRMRFAGGVVFFVLTMVYFSGALRQAPSGIDYQSRARARYNESKVGLLIENRSFPVLAPLMLHFISVVPPDWRFRFMGSIESVKKINESVAIQEQVRAGKLDLTYIPSNMTTGSQEEISRFLTTLWLYETVLQPAEWLLLFQTDSILCANSQRNLNDYLEYHWIGAPWTKDSRWGGNGGLSLRRVSAMIDVLREQVRIDGSDPEDVWLAERLGHRPKSKVANGTVSLTFSGESFEGAETRLDNFTLSNANSSEIAAAAKAGKLVDGVDNYRVGFYEPMGYHTGGSGKYLNGHVWGTPEQRRHIWTYCPEVKMTLAMDAAKFVPGECGAVWKRTVNIPGAHGVVDVGYGTEIIDDIQYPVLPPGLYPW